MCKLKERNLKFSNKYFYKSITRGSVIDAQFCACDNCGKLITNMVHVLDATNSINYTIGTDCAKNLANAKCLYNHPRQDFNSDLSTLKDCERFATELNKGKKYENHGDIYFKVLNDKQKYIYVFQFRFKQFYPELISN